MKSYAFLLLIAGMPLDAQLIVPQVGIARYSDGSVHLVRGLGANFIVGSRVIASAEGASFADCAGLLSKNGLIRLIQTDGKVLGEYRSSERLPVLHIGSSPQSAVVWLPVSHTLLRWDGSQFVEMAVDDSGFGGRVTFVESPSSGSALFFVTRSDLSVARVSVSLPSGRMVSSDTEPDARDWAFVQQGWILSQDRVGLTVQRSSRNRQTFPLSQQFLPPGDLIVEQMSNHWLHLSSQSTRREWAVYLDAARVNLFLLPSAAEMTR